MYDHFASGQWQSVCQVAADIVNAEMSDTEIQTLTH